jgi:hypothetical protein
MVDPITWEEAERRSGLRLDRRRRYAWGQSWFDETVSVVLELGSGVLSCSGCCELGEYGSGSSLYPTDPKHGCLIGAGCNECGHTGKRRWAMWLPLSSIIEPKDVSALSSK